MMRARRYGDALLAYEAGLVLVRARKPKQKPGSHEESPVALTFLFNVAEARRRATVQIHLDEWREVISVFEKSVAGISAADMPTRIKQLQAMHIAYASCGEITKAEELLGEVEKLCGHISPRERLFNVSSNEYVTVAEFLTTNAAMRDSILLKSQLWDGMPVRKEQAP